MKAIRFYEIIDNKIHEVDERVYRGRVGDTIYDEFFVVNVGDETIDEFSIEAQPVPFLFDFGSEDEPWNMVALDMTRHCIKFKAPNYWTNKITEYDFGGGLNPKDWIRIPYKLRLPYISGFYFMIQLTLKNEMSKFPMWRYYKELSWPYYNPNVQGKDFIFDLVLPHPPKFARWDYADLALYAEDSSTKYSDSPFVPYVWLERGETWKIRAHGNINTGSVYGDKLCMVYCGSKLPFRNRRISNPKWLIDQTPHTTTTISSWDTNNSGDSFIVRGNVRR